MGGGGLTSFIFVWPCRRDHKVYLNPINAPQNSLYVYVYSAWVFITYINSLKVYLELEISYKQRLV